MKKYSLDRIHDVETVQSATECTGLYAAAPDEPDDALNLSRLMAIHCPPDAMEEAAARPQSADEAAGPFDAPSPRRSTPGGHPARQCPPSRPQPGRNP